MSLRRLLTAGSESRATRLELVLALVLQGLTRPHRLYLLELMLVLVTHLP